MKKLAKTLSVVLALMLTMVLTQAAFVQAFAATADEQSSIEAETTVTEEVLASEEATEAEATTATEPVEEAQEEETAELDTYNADPEEVYLTGADLVALPSKVFTAPLAEDAVTNLYHEWTEEDENNSIARNMRGAVVRLYFDNGGYYDVNFEEPKLSVGYVAYYDVGLSFEFTVIDKGNYQAQIQFLDYSYTFTANHETEKPTDPPAPPVEERELKGIEVTKLPDKVFTAPLDEDAVTNLSHDWTEEDENNSVARNMQGAVVTFYFTNGDTEDITLGEAALVFADGVMYYGPDDMPFYVFDRGNYKAEVACGDFVTEFTAKNVNDNPADDANNNDGKKDDTAKADTANAANAEQKADTTTSDTAAAAAGNGVVATGSATVSVVLLSVLALAGCAMFVISRKKIFK